jgi:hypothetical protein
MFALHKLSIDLSNENIWFLIESAAELKKGSERGAFEAALKEADILLSNPKYPQK